MSFKTPFFSLVQSFTLGAFAMALSSATLFSAELIQNGNFEDVGVPGYAAQLSVHEVFNFNDLYATATSPGGSMEHGIQTLAGWQTNGYNFLMTPGSATEGGTGTIWNDYLTFWNVDNGGLGVIPATSPTGGNFIALDAAYEFGRGWPPFNEDPVNLTLPIWQEIAGLEVGKEYELSFYWAAAQQAGYEGDTWEYLTVSFGDDQYVTDTVQLPEGGYHDWSLETVKFTASATTQTLSFLAGGGPTGQPPFVFLDGISMKSVPEPSSMILVALGSACFILGRRRRQA